MNADKASGDATTTRKRIPTVKGLEYTKEQSMKKKKSLLSRVNIEANALQDAIRQGETQDTVILQYKKFEELYSEFCREHQEHMSLLRDQKELDDAQMWFKSNSIEFVKLEKEFSKSIKPRDVDEEDRHSTLSKASKVSSSTIKALRAEAAAKKAALVVGKEYNKRVEELRKQQEKLAKDLDELKENKQIAMISAEEAVYSRFEDDDSDGDAATSSKPQHPTVGYMPVIQQTWYPATYKEEVLEPDPPNESVEAQPATSKQASFMESNISRSSDRMVDMFETLVELQKSNGLPEEHPEIFSGKILEYPIWIRDFEDLVEARTTVPSRRLRLLGKSTEGEAHRCIHGYIGMKTASAYKAAREALDDWFGDPAEITRQYKTELKEWPDISSTTDRGRALRDFSHFLEQCKVLAGDSKYITTLDDDDLNQTLAAKLPKPIRDGWSRKAFRLQSEKKSFPTFAQFCEHVKYEAKLATLPVLGTAVLDKYVNERKSSTKQPTHRRSNQNNSRTFSSVTYQTQHPQCICCEDRNCNSLENCSKLVHMKYSDRLQFIKSKGLCFGCLEKGHMSRSCSNRKACTICNKNHLTLLHIFQPNSSTTPIATSNLSKTTHGCTRSTRIIPVLVGPRHGQFIETYAVLDEQSDASFVSSRLSELLNLCGTDISLKLSTMTSSQTVPTKRFTDLVVKNRFSQESVTLPICYLRDCIPVDRSQILRISSLKDLPQFKKIDIPDYIPELEVGLLLGTNCMPALEPSEVIYDRSHHCYAIRSILGWSTVGVPNFGSSNVESVCNRSLAREVVQAKEIIKTHDVLKVLQQDFFENTSSQDHLRKGLSIEDKRFLEICRSNIRQEPDGHFSLPLPFKTDEVMLPNNRHVALKRLQSIKRKFGDLKFKSDYSEFVQTMLEKGYAEEVTATSTHAPGRIWYLPHHAVSHPNKKIRVVFDGSARFGKISLNDHLLSGPDLTNNLVGVLLRFRLGHVAVMADIEKMFLQVRVEPNCRDFFRFLWWPNGDTLLNVKEYRMCSHLFGAVSSPSCANFTLKHIADLNASTYGKETCDFVKRNFYVDDGLLSVDSSSKAIEIVSNAKDLCAAGGFNLTKFVSNSNQVLESFSHCDLAPSMKLVDFSNEGLPLQRALGIQWNVEEDCFMFMLAIKEQSHTRRGILSTVCSIFDPLGFISPIVLEGKRILQRLCQENQSWDTSVSPEIEKRWTKWKASLSTLVELKIPRCYRPRNLGDLVKIELHHFSDASLHDGYGQCSYILSVDSSDNIHCSLLMAKSRVIPLKAITVPRLELHAAVTSAKIAWAIKNELSLESYEELFWTDSKVVLGYINNESKRFHIYVANRVEEIRNLSNPKQWHYVATDENPADLCSRGLSVKRFIERKSFFFNGPKFLHNINWKENVDQSYPTLDDTDPEVRISSFHTTCTSSFDLIQILSKFSTWGKMKSFFAALLRVKSYLKTAIRKEEFNFQVTFSVSELHDAEIEIIKLVQAKKYSREVEALTKLPPKKITNSSISKLDPFMDTIGTLRVGGRIRRSNLPESIKHPILIPKDCVIAKPLIGYFHALVHHQGRGITLNKIRSHGFWIVNGVSAVKSYIRNCVICRKLRGRCSSQHMSSLPVDRTKEAPPFTYSAVDLFGPFIVKQGRSNVKRYGILFTCMQSRAIRLDISPSLDTTSFINALRRFVCRNGPIRQLRCDRGTNFVGAANELERELKKMDNLKIAKELAEDYQCDYFKFEFNPPLSSHFGGIWERQIRSARSVLNAILVKHGHQLENDSLLTFLIEAEATVNSRPLTLDSLTCPNSLIPISPHNLLTLKSHSLYPPPGSFDETDTYSRRRWRRVQHLSNEFWHRWRKEYLLIQQERSKWYTRQRNVRVGDIVILIENAEYRNKWITAIVDEAYPSDDGLVRKVKLRLANGNLSQNGKPRNQPSYALRSVTKLVIIVETENSINEA